jgi:hypothetical protein
MKFIKFFHCLWVIFALLDPDCESGSGLDPDPEAIGPWICIRIRIHNLDPGGQK